MLYTLYFTVCFSLTLYASEAVKVTAVFNFNCSNNIPDDPNSIVHSITATYIYDINITCANFNLSSGLKFNVEINGTITSTELVLSNRSILPYNGNLLFISFGKVISGSCIGADWGRLTPIPTKQLTKCAAGECNLNYLRSLPATMVIINGGCGFNICTSKFTSYTFEPPLQ